MHDAVGSFGTEAACFDALRRGGVRVRPRDPPGSPCARDPQGPKRWKHRRHRKHRKIVVIDGTAACTGGTDIGAVHAADSCGRARRADPPVAAASAAAGEGWRDTPVRLTGPAVPAATGCCAPGCGSTSSRDRCCMPRRR